MLTSQGLQIGEKTGGMQLTGSTRLRTIGSSATRDERNWTMHLLDAIVRRTPAATDPAPEIRTDRPAAPIGLDDDSDSAGTLRYILEPYFVVMEYCDAQATVSRRRITMRSVIDKGGVRYLHAVCHERRALRTFRLDRVTCFITQDGEVEDAQAWFAEVLPISETAFEPGPSGPTAEERARRAQSGASVSPYTALRREIAQPLTLLIAAARSDDHLHPREVTRILRYAEDEAVLLRQAGRLPGNPEGAAFDKLERTIRRLRPTREDVLAALDNLMALDLPRKRNLARALADTALADGHVDAIEADLIDELQQVGSRSHGIGWEG